MWNFSKLNAAVLLSLSMSTAYADINIDVQPTTPTNGYPFQSFRVNVDSTESLKQIKVEAYPAQWCRLPYYAFRPEAISGQHFSKDFTFNFRNHKGFNGSIVCVYVEDEQGNKQVFQSHHTLNLTQPNIDINHVNNDTLDFKFVDEISQGQTINKVNYFYRQQHAGTTQSFELNGQAEQGTDIAITDYNGNIIQLAEVDDDGNWSVEGLDIEIHASSVNSGTNFQISSLLKSDHNVTLSSERLLFSGKKVDIEIYQRPQVPLHEKKAESGQLNWGFNTPLSIINTRILMLEQADQCGLAEPQAKIIQEVGQQHRFNFFGKTELHGYFACIQIEDSEGNFFTEPVGWIKQEPKPEIIINDSVDAEVADSDTISGYINGAQQVYITYLSDNGYKNRDSVWNTCESRTSGTLLKDNEIYLELSAPTLNDHYLCIIANNGQDGLSYWMSEHKLNLINGLDIEQNLQPRLPSTPYPTQLNIPSKLQNATIGNPGCRGVLLAADLIMSAGHCEASFFHPKNGEWSYSPISYSYLVAQDEKDHKQYSEAQNDLFVKLRNNQISYEEFQFQRTRLSETLSKFQNSRYNVYFSPYFGNNNTAGPTFSDYVLRNLNTPYSGNQETIDYPQPLVYTFPSSLHLKDGEFRSHGIHENNPNSGWRGGKIHTLMPAGGNTVEYTMVDTAGGESGSALWAYDEDFDTYGVIGAVRGGGAWSSLWNHSRVTRQALSESRAKQLLHRRQAYEGSEYNYRDLRRALAKADLHHINKIIESGVNVNLDGHGNPDGWMLARAIDFAVQAKNKLSQRNNIKHQQKFQARLNAIKALMLGGADPRLTISKPTRYMTTEAGDSVLHYAVRTNAPKVMQAIWLNTTDYAFESQSRQVLNAAGDSPLHVAIDYQVDKTITRMMFADVGEDLFIQDAQGVNVLTKLLSLPSMTNEQIEMIDWIGKAFSYEPVRVNSQGELTHSDWLSLVCHRQQYQGGEFTFNQLADLRKSELPAKATAAIARLGNISGVDASQYCR
ncbi:hypothetical protein D5R81_13865 [Parashewanella spongiae]|uniref:Uncharacterized protein n=1 Tax=Parashewanella spongiae TaxID=342950 RepID=A0A3A6TJ24_9GAMM|nr:hypothetical protein [Parashewanella spongiae]MCL1079043.1 hypothetical protein [Parashewanella spongiae]RJY10804.1 hypothetical protein D5R81_13865 [Parashewanella spongiae]